MKSNDRVCPVPPTEKMIFQNGDSAMDHRSAVVPSVINRFRELYPEWMKVTVDPYLSSLSECKRNGVFNFSSLLGETQQGKTLVMHIITWIMIYSLGMTPCFITKKLQALRDDALDKLSGGMVNKIVDDVCSKLGKPKLGAKYHIIGAPGLTVLEEGVSIGVIPIYLMQPENNAKMLLLMERLQKQDRYPVFICDEVHEMYTNIQGYLDSSKLSLDTDRIHNHAVIHTIVNQCKIGKCGMLGVTATPQRMLTSDPAVYPSALYSIPCISPAPGLHRFGYRDGSDHFEGAEFHVDTDVLSIISKILARPRTQLSNGDYEIKFLNIATAHFNDDMANIHGLITDHPEFQDLVYAKLFIQDGAYDEINAPSLDGFFDLREVSDQVLSDGVIILIGKSREAAGITIKPSFNLLRKGWHSRLISDERYTVTGITDMMVSLPKNMETAEQLFGRASGWFDRLHELHFWLESMDQVNDVMFNVLMTKRALVKQYDGNIGPASLAVITNACLSIPSMTPNHLYYSGKKGIIFTLGADKPIGHRLPTKCYQLDQSLYDIYRQIIETEPQRGRSSRAHSLRAMISRKYGLHGGLHISWDKSKDEELYTNVVRPSANGTGIDSYVIADEGQLHLVTFTQPWTKRPQLSNECLYWKERPGHYRCAVYSNTMHHKYYDRLFDWEFDEDEHQQALDKVTMLVNKSTEPKRKNLYSIFIRIHTLRKLNATRPPDMSHQRWISGKWSTFKTEFASLYKELDTYVRESTEPETTVFSEVNRKIEEFITPESKSKSKPAPKIKRLTASIRSDQLDKAMPKIRAKLRAH